MTVFYNKNIIEIFVIIFLSQQGFCLPDDDSVEGYNFCMDQIKFMFGSVKSPIPKTKHLFLNVVVTDNMPVFALKYYMLMGLCVDASKCESIVEFCNKKNLNEDKVLCKSKLNEIFKSAGSGEFDENKASDCFDVAYYYMRENDVNSIKLSYFTEYFDDLYNCFDVNLNITEKNKNGYIKPSKFCRYLIGGKKLHNLGRSELGECVEKINTVFNHYEQPLENARFAFQSIRITENLSREVMAYYHNLLLCLDASEVPSVYEYCNKKLPELQNICFRDIVAKFSKFKPGNFSATNALDSLITGFKYMRSQDFKEDLTQYPGFYFYKIHLKLRLNYEKTPKNEHGYLTPENLCKLLREDNYQVIIPIN